MSKLAVIILKKFIFMYQYGYSRYRAPTCRYIPTCSDYALQAIEKYGALKGTYLAIRRILRCNPYSKRDLYDPVP